MVALRVEPSVSRLEVPNFFERPMLVAESLSGDIDRSSNQNNQNQQIEEAEDDDGPV